MNKYNEILNLSIDNFDSEYLKENLKNCETLNLSQLIKDKKLKINGDAKLVRSINYLIFEQDD